MESRRYVSVVVLGCAVGGWTLAGIFSGPVARAESPLPFSAERLDSGEPASSRSALPVTSRQVQSPEFLNRRVQVSGTVDRLLAASGDSLLYVLFDDYRDPVYVRTTHAGPKPQSELTVTGMVLRDPELHIPGGSYLFEEARTGRAAGDASGRAWLIAGMVGALAGGGAVAASRWLRPRGGRPRSVGEAAVPVRRHPAVIPGAPALGQEVRSISRALAVKPEAATVVDRGVHRPTPPAPRDPTQSQWGMLVAPSGPKQSWPLYGARIPLGRDHAFIPIPESDFSVSGSHGVLVWEGDGAYYEDTSMNGSLVNREPVHGRRVALADGDLLQVGQSGWRLSLAGGVVPRRVAGAPTQILARRAAPSRGTAEYHRAYLRVVRGPDEGKTAPLFGRELTIGRGENQSLRLEHPTVSRSHAVVRWDDGQCVLQNVSAKGTRVAGEKVDQLVLQGGEEFEVGADTIRFVKEI